MTQPLAPSTNGTPLAPPSVAAPVPSLPTAVQAPVPPPPTIPPDSQRFARAKPEDIANPFERQAAMVVQAAYDAAERLAANLSDQATNTAEADSSTVHDMWHYSPYGTDAPRQFWIVHDQILHEATQANDPDPYAAAERGALDAVWPYRSKIALLDQLGPQQAVSRAEQLRRMSENQTAAGNTPDALPHVTGPQALPQEGG